MIVGVTLVPTIAEHDRLTTAEQVLPAVVLIKGVDSHGAEISGSGFLVHASGTIITNLHVIHDLKQAAVKLSTGDIYDQLTVRAFDERKDLAVIQIPGYALPTIKLGDSDALRVGDSVLLVGNPLGILERSVSAGIVSAIRQSEDGYRVIQTDAAANPGSSGGPMIDSEGRAVGVVTFKIRGTESLNFVIPINYVQGLLAATGSIALEDLSTRLGRTTDVFAAPHLPSRWKSLATGTVKTIRIDGDHLYVETILPDERIKAGDFTLAEFTKDGTKYVGKVRTRLTCMFRSAWDLSPRYKTCTEEHAMSVDSLTETRIEGTAEEYPQNDHFSCRSCTHSEKPQTTRFVWIPE